MSIGDGLMRADLRSVASRSAGAHEIVHFKNDLRLSPDVGGVMNDRAQDDLVAHVGERRAWPIRS